MTILVYQHFYSVVRITVFDVHCTFKRSVGRSMTLQCKSWEAAFYMGRTLHAFCYSLVKKNVASVLVCSVNSEIADLISEVCS